MVSAPVQRNFCRVEWEAVASARILREGGALEARVRVRELSRGGLVFEHRTFQHAGISCDMDLPTTVGGSFRIRGRVASCVFIGDGLHRVGVEFEDPLPMEKFLDRRHWPPALVQETAAEVHLTGRLGFLDDCRLTHRLIRTALDGSGLQVDCFQAADAMLEGFRTNGFDLAVLDYHLGPPDSDGVAAARALRNEGFVGPMILATGDEAAAGQSADAGFDLIVVKPYAFETMRASVVELADRYHLLDAPPELHSTLDESSGSRAALPEFLAAAKRLHAEFLQAAASDSVERLLRLVEQLRSLSGGFGFPDLERAADGAVRALRASSSISESRCELLPVAHMLRRLSA